MITVGIDEVGRGCWAGPLVAGAVILDRPIDGLRDSKKLSRNQREKLDLIIRENTAGAGLGWVWPQEIDEQGITWAVGAAMERALAEVNALYDEIIIDGNINYLDKNPMVNRMVNHMENITIKTMVGADDKIPCVSAASIIAKVARDNYMRTVAAKYPQYGFENHVGYGTAAHLAALLQAGVCDIHRKSFKPVKALLKLAS